jgi:cell division protein FtsX
MTDRIHSFTVVLDHDLREDDAKPIVDAIKQLRGVVSVEMAVAGIGTQMAEARAKREFGQALMDVLYPPKL